MMLIDQILLLVLFSFGAVISYQDFRIHKIKNILLVGGFIAGLLVYLLFLVTSYKLQVIDIILNFGISILVSYILWKTKAWAAGDAKLFIMFSFLLPLSFYSASRLPLFPSFALLLNIFIVVFVFLIIRSSYYYLKTHNDKKGFLIIGCKKTIGSIFKNYNLFLSIYILIILFNFYNRYNNYIDIDIFTIQTLIFAILIIFSGYLSEFFQKKIIKKIIPLVFCIVVILGFFWGSDTLANVIFESSLMIIIYMVLFILFQDLVDLYVERNEAKKININKLEKGMVLDEKVVEDLNIMKKVSLHPKGLSVEQVDFIVKIAKEVNINQVTILKPFPFAFWMFLGVMVTVLVKGSIINYIINNI